MRKVLARRVVRLIFASFLLLLKVDGPRLWGCLHEVLSKKKEGRGTVGGRNASDLGLPKSPLCLFSSLQTTPFRSLRHITSAWSPSVCVFSHSGPGVGPCFSRTRGTTMSKSETEMAAMISLLLVGRCSKLDAMHDHNHAITTLPYHSPCTCTGISTYPGPPRLPRSLPPL